MNPPTPAMEIRKVRHASSSDDHAFAITPPEAEPDYLPDRVPT